MVTGLWGTYGKLKLSASVSSALTSTFTVTKSFMEVFSLISCVFKAVVGLKKKEALGLE